MTQVRAHKGEDATGKTLLVSEIFMSIQGESSYAGLPCVFVRLAGCNLRCSWCDTSYARTDEDSRALSVEAIAQEVRKFRCNLVEITGGEPLLQDGARELALTLVDEGREVLIETNGSVSLEGIDGRVIKIIDVKCPSSGHAGSFLMENLRFIGPADEVKFVIGNAEDYDFARRFVEEWLKDGARVLFAPVSPELSPAILAEWLLRDRLKARLQIQLHKYIWEEGRGR